MIVVLSHIPGVVCSGTMNAGALQIDLLRAELTTVRVGRRIEYLASTTSTNDEVWQRIHTDDADGLVVFAEHQSAGRGRFGRTWTSPPGASLLCSVALIDERSELRGGALGLLTAVAACDAVTACTDVTPTIKWPNDLLVSGRKLGGILIESRAAVNPPTVPPLRGHGKRIVRAYVVGIGINCLQQRVHLPSGPAEPATSLALESKLTRGGVDRTALARSLLQELDRWLAGPREWSDADLRREWLQRAEPMGRRVYLRHAGKVFSGSMIDLDPTAALLVQLDEGGVRAFDAASATIVDTPDEATRWVDDHCCKHRWDRESNARSVRLRADG